MNFPRRNQGPHGESDLDAREDPYNEAQASRIYILPNLMTAGNLLCGFMAVISCIRAKLAGTSDDGLYLAATASEHYR
jgi:CDP-diacylglycerol---serine O-phosphatidyltransferase